MACFLCYHSSILISNKDRVAHLIGASAGVRALLIFLCLVHALSRSLFHLPFGRLNLKYVAYFIILIDVLGAFGVNSGGFIAHIGGDLLGMYFYSNLYSSNKNPLFNWGSIKSYFFTKSKMKYYKNENVKKRNLKVTL